MIHGHVDIYQAGKLLKSGANEVHQDLWDYLSSRIDGGSDSSARTLFTKFGDQEDHTGKDGIILLDAFNDEWKTVPTNLVASPNSWSRRWQGTFIPEETITFQHLQLGHDLQSPSGDADKFDVMYATKDEGEELNYAAEQPLVIIWTISINRVAEH